ncbi:hypothetical protein ACWASM_001055 [Enterobacter cloacae]|uniref:hypothetical protein n=1 Tax=Enterobacter cloacae complex TaxID=354276 RepID=UPI001FF6DB32|nr:hypothetical protein [Enterobacter cloacae]MCK1075310.1 hypothetical protein [Enterobacter cloacae subsp. cloacae]HCT2369321.1 hypothetical protein [Enterobacter cloacae]
MSIRGAAPILEKLSYMTKLGTINFDDRIIDALRDGQIVVFAGAGVSMGPPSNLSSFWKLTSDIAQGSGYVPCEPLDRFLGQLHPHLGDEFPEAVALAIRSPKIRIGHSHVFYDLRTSELVTRFPTETAELLVYLSSCTFGYNANDLIKIEMRLPLIPANVRRSLDEAFAHAGLIRGE